MFFITFLAFIPLWDNASRINAEKAKVAPVRPRKSSPVL